MIARLLPVLSILRRAVRNFYADSGLDLSAAVAFYTLLSMGPVLYLLGATLGWIFKNRYSTESVLANFSSFAPVEVMDAFSHVNLGVRTEKGLVFLALPALLWGAIRGFTAVGRAMNRAFGTTRQRANWLARLKALAILGLGLLLLSLAIVASTLLPRLERLFVEFGLPRVPVLFNMLNKYLLAPLVSYVTFVLFYKLLPYGRVAWRPALWGALMTVVLWDGAQRLFSGMLAHSYGFGLLSGSLAGIVTFLLWIYTATAITLLGAELAAILNGRPDPPRKATDPGR